MSLKNSLAAGLAATVVACGSAEDGATQPKTVTSIESGGCYMQYPEGTHRLNTAADVAILCKDTQDHAISCIFANPATVGIYTSTNCSNQAKKAAIIQYMLKGEAFECIEGFPPKGPVCKKDGAVE